MASINTYPYGQYDRNRFREAAAVSVQRVLDCCSDRECLEDLQLFFTAQDQATIQASGSVRGVRCEVTDVTFSIRDFMTEDNGRSVDCVFYFSVELQVYPAAGGEPFAVTGYATHQKQTLLYGGEGGVRTFSSAGRVYPPTSGLDAAAQVSDPVLLGVRLSGNPSFFFSDFNDEISRYFAERRLVQPAAGEKTVLCSLGLFSVISLERTVQILVPSYDYAIPEKDCQYPSHDPCEVFRQMRFPTGKFFPRKHR